MLASINYQNLKSFFPSAPFQKGEEYYLQGNVEHLEISSRGAAQQITARVKNSLDKRYDVIIHVSGPAAHLHIRGICSCPMAINCKHVVAALLQALPRPPVHQKQSAPVDSLTLSPELTIEAWLEALNRVMTSDEITADHVDETFSVLYVLSNTPHHLSELRLAIGLARRLKTGEWGDLKILAQTNAAYQRYLHPEDKTLLVKLDMARKLSGNIKPSEYTAMTGKIIEDLLPELLATGRCYWLSAANPPLTLGRPQKADFVWHVDERGFQTLWDKNSNGTDKTCLWFSIDHPWYLNKETGEFGLLETELENEVAKLLLASPPIPPEHAKNVYNLIKIHKKLDRIPPPLVFKKVKVEKVEPICCLRLFQEKIISPLHHRNYWPGFQADKPLAALSFRYKGITVSWEETNDIIQTAEGEQLIKIKRNRKKEQRALDDLFACGLMLMEDMPELANANKKIAHYFLLEAPDCDPLDFSVNTVAILQARGWEIEIANDYPYQIVNAPIDDWYSSVEEKSNYDWFGLELGIMIKGEKINLLPVLQQLFQQRSHPLKYNKKNTVESDKSVIAQLPDQRFIALPRERVNNILNVLIELCDKDSLNEEKMLHLSKLHAVRLLELDAAMGATKLRWFGGENLRKLGAKLRQFKGIEVTRVPDQFKGELRPYQLEGLSWLQFLREYELGGILADDMGLGKTIQALSHILVERLSGRMKFPILVIAPTSLMFNWRIECERFVPELNVLVLHGTERKQSLENISHYDLILTTYPLIVRDKKFLLAQEFHLLILDEAQFIKNSKSQAAQVAQQLKAKHRLCLTGTPLENHLGELWSLFHFMMPGLLGDEKMFNRLFRVPIEKQGDQERRLHLTQRISPFLLRRTKDNVVAELPKKTEMIQYVEIDDAQRDLYETIRMTMEKKVRDEIAKMGLGRSHIIILDALLKLRQICCDPRLLKMQTTKKNLAKSAKMALLMTLLPELIEDGRRILLFSQFTEMLELIEEELKKTGIPYVKLTGKTKNREAVVKQFQEGKVPLFLISLKAGGTGLNLTMADTVIHYDPWWNPAVENQATDRAHRIGQEKKVFVYKLVAKGTVEEKILQMQHHKQTLMDGLFSESTASKLTLSEQDLRDLFEPLG